MSTSELPIITSPPTSPPAKRVKTDTSASTTITNGKETNMTAPAVENNGNGTAVPVLDQAPPLLIKKLSETAKLPARGSAFAAGYDIFASKATTIPARGKALVDTDIAIAVPAGTCMSSIASHLFLVALSFPSQRRMLFHVEQPGRSRTLTYVC